MSKIGLNIGNVYNVISTSLTTNELEHSVLEPNKMIVSCETNDSGTDMSEATIAGITDNDGKFNKMSINDPTVNSIGKVIAYNMLNNKWPEYKFNDISNPIYRNINIQNNVIVSKPPVIKFSYSNCFSPICRFEDFITLNTYTYEENNVVTTYLTLNTDINTIKYGKFNERIEIFPNIYKDIKLVVNDITVSVYLWTIPYFVEKAHSNLSKLFSTIDKTLDTPISENVTSSIGISDLQHYKWSNVKGEPGNAYSHSSLLKYNSFFDIAELMGNEYIDEVWGPTTTNYYEQNGQHYLDKLNDNNISYTNISYSFANVNNLYIGLSELVYNTANITIGISHIINTPYTGYYSPDNCHIIRMTSNRFTTPSMVRESLTEVIYNILEDEEHPNKKYNEPCTVSLTSYYSGEKCYFSASSVKNIIWELLDNSYFMNELTGKPNNKVAYFINNYRYSNSYSISQYTYKKEYAIKDLQQVGKDFRPHKNEENSLYFVKIFKVPISDFYFSICHHFADYIKQNYYNLYLDKKENLRDYNYSSDTAKIETIWSNFINKYKLIDKDPILNDKKKYYQYCFINDLILNHLLPDFAANSKKYGITLHEDYKYPKLYIRADKK